MAHSRALKQAELRFPSWGGARKGAGRKRRSARPRVSHTVRESFASRFPVHVTLRLRSGLPSLRRERTYRVFLRALAAGAEREGFRCVHYSAQSNHVHMVCEARERLALARGVQGLSVRIARALNRLWARKGGVYDDRYHARILKSPREVRSALAYVLRNAQHHGLHLHEGIDPFSSAAWFDGWRVSGRSGRRILDVRGSERGRPDALAPLARARTWLLSLGWRRWGLIEIEGPSRAPA